MIKIEKLILRNYKNIAEAILPLNEVNVVVGENNVGKTNLLESIPLLNFIINGSVNEVRRSFERTGRFDLYNYIGTVGIENERLYLKKPISFEVEFSDSESDTIFNYSLVLSSTPESPLIADFFKGILIENETLTYKSRTKPGAAKEVFDRHFGNVEYGTRIKKDGIISTLENHVSVVRILSIIIQSENIGSEEKDAVNFLNRLLSSNIFYFSSHLLKDSDAKFEGKSRIAHFDIDEHIMQLSKSSYWDEYKLMLSDALNIRTIQFLNIEGLKGERREKPYFFHNNNLKRLSEFSDGTVILIALITKIFLGETDVFLIEEPENSIHPSALHKLMNLIRSRSIDKQFIITTHSPYLLNMIKPEEVFVASFNKEGGSTIGKLPDVKAIKRQLAKGFIDFGDLVFNEAREDGE